MPDRDRSRNLFDFFPAIEAQASMKDFNRRNNPLFTVAFDRSSQSAEFV